MNVGPPTQSLGRRGWAAPVLCGAVSAGYLLARTAPFGPGLDSDSAQHLSAAASLVEQGRWIGIDGEPYVLWPPLYSLLLAALEACGLAAGDAVRALHATCLLANALLAAALAWRLSGSRIAAGAAALAACWATLPVAAMAWSECAFTSLVLLALLAWLEWSHTRSNARLLLLGAACALALLQRYVGASLLACVALGVLFTGERAVLRARLARSVALGVTASLPLLAWMLRCQFVVTESSARRGPPSDDWGLDLAAAAAQLAPRSLALSLESWCELGAALLLATGVWRLCRAGCTAAQRVVALFPLAFGIGLVALRHFVEFDPIDARLMAPARVVAAIVAASCLGDWLTGRWRALALVLWVAPAATLEVVRLQGELESAAADGIGLYDSARWRDSEAAEALRESVPEGRGYTNEPHALYLLAGLRTRALPQRPGGFPRLYERWAAAPPQRRWILWFPFNDRARLPQPAPSVGIALSAGPSYADARMWLSGPEDRGERTAPAPR